MRLKYHIFILILVSYSCSDDLINEEFSNNPVDNFESVWTEYDKTYGAFEAKKINWDSLYKVYRPMINKTSSDADLYNVLCSLLTNLNDGHVQLIAPNFQKYYSVPLRTIYPDSKYYESATNINYLFLAVKSFYLIDIVEDGNFIYGTIKTRMFSKNIKYIRIPTFNEEEFKYNFIKEALKKLKGSDGVIIDLRFNGGGSTQTYTNFLNHFADKKRLYLMSKIRNGPKHSDFTNFLYHYIEPVGDKWPSIPIVVLVNKFSASSSEHFVLGIKSLPYTKIVGDTTYGALSTVIEKIMPNGWLYRTCPQVVYDTLGNYLTDSKGRYLDGIGIAPDIKAINYLYELKRGYDNVLEKAIDILYTK